MKYLLFVFLFLMPFILQAQSVSVTEISAHSANNQSTFPLAEGIVTSSDNNVKVQGASATSEVGNVVDWAISSGNQKTGLLSRGQGVILNILDYQGNKLIEKELEFFDPSDETLAVELFDDGRSVIRDNVANFSFFDARGEMQYTISNSSQSPDGERESQLAADPSGSTIVLYNPVIAYGRQKGSQARLVPGNGQSEVFFRSNNTQITNVSVSKNGAFIVLLTSSGSGDRVLVFDRFGTELTGIDTDSGQKNAVLSENGDYITIYSSGRVQVYNMLTGERLGSTSSTTPVTYAAYQPEDETIIMIGGSETANGVSNPTVTAVHLTKRQIAREDTGFSLAALDKNNISLERRGANRFRLTGFNKHLEIRTTF